MIFLSNSFWFKPDWNGGAGPGNAGRLLEMGDTNSAGGWWSLWVDSTGSMLNFQSKSNGALTTYFSQPIGDWYSNGWYQLVLNYSTAGTSLYTNGALAQSGSGMAYYPTISNRMAYGFSVGSDHNGQNQIRGVIDELHAYTCPLSQAEITALTESTTNQIPDWWMLEYFGTLNLNENSNYDNGAGTLLQDYQNGVDPNVIAFNLSLTNQYVNTANVPMQVSVTAGVPFYMAWLVDSTNWAGANWIPYTASPVVNVGATQGWHQIWFGLRGLPPATQQTWNWYRVKVDTTPPALVITNPPSPNVMQPMIEVQGYCAEPLASLTYDVSNAAGVITNQLAIVLNQVYTTNTWEFTTNAFQAFDVSLTNGANVLTFHASDLAGNVTTTNFTYTLSYASRTNPPVL